MSKDICLCVVFNHSYPQNIPVLREIYAGRFKHIRFLLPMTRLPDNDVITVYRGAYAHAAFVTDALHALMPLKCSHYAFVQDDVLLAPGLDQKAMYNVLKLDKKTGFIGNFFNRESDDIGEWGFWPGMLWRLLYPRNLLSGTGAESWEVIKAALPPRSVADLVATRYRVHCKTLVRTDKSLAHPLMNWAPFGGGDRAFDVNFYDAVFKGLLPEGGLTIDYPLFNSGPLSDFYVLPKGALAEFAHIAGALSAGGAFTEVTVGTAMALAVENVNLANDLRLRMDWWTHGSSGLEILEKMAADPSIIAAHPLKLSGEGMALAAEIKDRRHIPVKPYKAGTKLEEARAIEADFDEAAYLELNPDVAKAGVDAATHFMTFGRYEGRAWRL